MGAELLRNPDLLRQAIWGASLVEWKSQVNPSLLIEEMFYNEDC